MNKSVPSFVPITDLLYFAGIYATGPFAHLFHGVVEQNYIFHVMDHALCLTESKQKFCTKPVDRGGPSRDTNNGDTVGYNLHVMLVFVFIKLFL